MSTIVLILVIAFTISAVVSLASLRYMFIRLTEKYYLTYAVDCSRSYVACLMRTSLVIISSIAQLLLAPFPHNLNTHCTKQGLNAHLLYVSKFNNRLFNPIGLSPIDLYLHLLCHQIHESSHNPLACNNNSRGVNRNQHTVNKNKKSSEKFRER